MAFLGHHLNSLRVKCANKVLGTVFLCALFLFFLWRLLVCIFLCRFKLLIQVVRLVAASTLAKYTLELQKQFSVISLDESLQTWGGFYLCVPFGILGSSVVRLLWEVKVSLSCCLQKWNGIRYCKITLVSVKWSLTLFYFKRSYNFSHQMSSIRTSPAKLDTSIKAAFFPQRLILPPEIWPIMSKKGTLLNFSH